MDTTHVRPHCYFCESEYGETLRSRTHPGCCDRCFEEIEAADGLTEPIVINRRSWWFGRALVVAALVAFLSWALGWWG